jgi:hypothetical protein
MAEFLKVLGQISPTPSILTDVYTVPAGRSAVISTIFICNTSGATAFFRISVAVAGAADDISQYIYFDRDVEPTDTFASTSGFSLSTGDIVRVYSDTANVAFSIYGAEVT